MKKNPFADQDGKPLFGKLSEFWEFEEKQYEKHIASLPKDEAHNLLQQKRRVSRRYHSEISAS